MIAEEGSAAEDERGIKNMTLVTPYVDPELEEDTP